MEDANCVDLEWVPQVCVFVGGGGAPVWIHCHAFSLHRARQGITGTPFLFIGKQQFWLHGVSILQSLSLFGLMLVIIPPV